MADPIWMCVLGKLGDSLSEAQAEQLTNAYERLARAHPQEPPTRIAERLAHLYKDRRNATAAQRARQLEASSRVAEFQQGQRTAKEQIESSRYVMSRDTRGKYKFGQNFEAVRSTVLAQIHSRLAGVIQEMSPRWFQTVQNRAQLDEVGQALMGRTDGLNPEAVALGKATREMFDDIRQRFRAYGVRLREARNFIPARSDPALVRRVSFEEWRDFIKARTFVDQRINRDTGERFTPEELDEVLKSIYTKITTGDGDLFGLYGEKSFETFVERMEQSRFFDWKDYDAWKEYQERFGNGGNLMETLATYANQSARDLAILHTLGTDPLQTLREMKARNDALAVANPKQAGRAARANKAIDHEWEVISGAATQVVDPRIAAGEEHVTFLSRLALLGGSGLATVADLVLSGSTSMWYGLSNNLGLPGFFREFMAFYRRDTSGRARQLLEGGFGADAFLSSLLGNSRAMGEFVGPRVLHRTTDAFFRLNGTVPITEAVRNTNTTAALIGMGDLVRNGFAGNNRRIARELQSYGVTEDLLRKVRDGGFLRDYADGEGLDIPALTRELGTEAAAPFTAVLNDIRYMSSPAPSVAVRAFLYQGLKPGTFPGVVMRSLTAFWQFPMTAFATQVQRRLMASDIGWANKGTQVAALAIVGTIAGALLAQARTILSGREPMDWDEPELWKRGLMMSGVLGIWGDYLARDVGAWQSASAAIGPFLGPMTDLGAAIAGVWDEDANAGASLSRFVRAYTPGRNFPVAGVAINRLMLEPLRELVDPNAQRAYRGQITRTRRDTGQEFWWRPGENLPEALK